MNKNMKQIYLQLLFLLCGITAYGQDILDFRMCDVYNGKVKSIVVTSPEMMQSEIEFSLDGKTKYMKNSTFQIDYEWKSDEELKLNIRNSQESQNYYIYINEYRKDYYDYDLGEMNMKIWFRNNGSLDKKEITQGGNKMISTYYYHNDSELYPYKIENRMGTQTQIVFINVEKCDSKGNAIVFSQTCNGITIRQEREISYYK